MPNQPRGTTFASDSALSEAGLDDSAEALRNGVHSIGLTAHVTWLDGTVETFPFVGGQRQQRKRMDDTFVYTDSAEFSRKDGDTLYFVQTEEPERQNIAAVSARIHRDTLRYLWRARP